MKTPKPRVKTMNLKLTSMIDVIFLMIIFFVMSNRLIQDEAAIEMNLPREASGETIVDDDSNKIVVNVESEDAIYIGMKKVTYEELKERLKREKSLETRPTQVRVRANRDVPYGAIEPILVICAQTGFSDVSFAVVER